MAETPAELLALCREGDESAIQRLLRCYEPPIRDLLTALLRDSHLVDDAVQETFVAALAALPQLRKPEAFPAWLRQIARSRANRILRKGREPLTGVEFPPSPEPSPRKCAENRELRQLVLEAIRLLPPASRETTELFYLDERSCSEISDLLQIPRSSVRRRLYDARSRLRSLLLGYLGKDFGGLQEDDVEIRLKGEDHE